MKTLLLMAVVLSAFLHLLLLLIEGISMTFLSLEVVDATMRAFRYAAASTIQFLLIGVCRFFSVSRLENTFFAGSPRVTPNLSERLHQLGFGLVALVAKPLLVVLIPIAHFGHRYKKRSIVMDFVAVLEDVGEGRRSRWARRSGRLTCWPADPLIRHESVQSSEHPQPRRWR
ncbi:hypothetical protein GQ600_3440 [Phytophthora cactorum]|nr:hypothetical protein GQ600_3440 [Phytophthora cactorum]